MRSFADQTTDAPSLARRTLNATLLAGGTALACWLWWDWWTLEFRRAEPWRAVLGWWGDAVALLWCLFALLRGRANFSFSLDPSLSRRTSGSLADRKRAARWAWAGMMLSVTADLGITASQGWADWQGENRSVPAEGQVVSAEASPPDKHGDRQVRLVVRFPTPDGPHVGAIGVRLDAGPNPQLSREVTAWLRRTIDGAPAGPLDPPEIEVRYDPQWPDRFWVDQMSWNDWTFARFFLMGLPAMQAAWLLMDAPDVLRGIPDDNALAAMGPWAVAVVTLPLLIFCGVMQQMGW
ncbi:hypothetical protein LzC2_18770 [Planctomycetes bacterium LzC2]|uniref:Uncharacterized protein n=1 Tax=Alienimonas chondri TaxID=2681879 RepID=A0ABX1VET6_9PLAN|nr:hypothetical protein [Alienimonas chondri]